MGKSVKATETETKTVKNYSEAEVQELIAKAVAQAMANVQNQTQTVIKVREEDEYVTVLFIGGIAMGTTVALGKLGKINRAGGTLDIPKKVFMQGLGNQTVDALLRNRSLIVVNGLTDEERERFGVKYKEQELLTQDMFYKIMDYGRDEIVTIFEKLCEEHKRVVAKMYLDAYFEKHDNRVNVSTVKALNKLSRAVDKEGLFTPILEDYGKKIVEDE